MNIIYTNQKKYIIEKMHQKDLTTKKIFTIASQNHQKNNFKVAKNLYKKILKINPNHFESIFYLGVLLLESNNFDRAKQLFQKAIRIQPNYAPAHNNLGIIFNALEEAQKAISSYQKAIRIQPNYAPAHNNLGMVFGELGEFEKAISSYQMAVKYEPENLAHYYYLSDLKEEILHSNLKNKIYEIIKKRNSTKKNIAYGNFLLSRYELKAKNYKKEFNHLLKGHHYYFESRSKQFKTQVKYWLNVLPNIKELVNLNKSSKNIKKNNNKINPIFIIGVPRCGSTLVEKVIISGAKYIPAGEETEILNFFVKQKIQQKQLLKSDIENFQKKIIEKYKQKGLIQEISDYTFTDKSLDNFFYISLIKEIFPYAKVINCKRDALSCIMSILKNNLTGLAWTHNLEHIFRYLNIYYRMIEKFKKIHPNFIYELQYEKFVKDPEIESKKLLKFCNLPWDKKCLQFFKRKDLISQTASNIQIRKAIYKDSIKKYLPYKQFLNKYGYKYSWFN